MDGGPAQVLEASDPASHVAGRLTIVAGTDGGAAAAIVELRNTSGEHHVAVSLNADLTASVMLTATDRRGQLLSPPPAVFDMSDRPVHVTLELGPGGTHRWYVPVAERVPAANIPPDGVPGRLVVTVAVDVTIESGPVAPDAAPAGVILTLYDMDVRYTTRAAVEGTLPVE